MQRFSWHFKAYSGEGCRVVSGCETGPVNQANSRNCTIQLTGGSAFHESAPRGKLSLLAPVKSVTVALQGWDAGGSLYEDSVSLIFR